MPAVRWCWLWERSDHFTSKMFVMVSWVRPREDRWWRKISNRRTSHGYTLQRWKSVAVRFWIFGKGSFSVALSNVWEVFPFTYAPIIGHETKCAKHGAHDTMQTHGCVHFMCVTRCVIHTYIYPILWCTIDMKYVHTKDETHTHEPPRAQEKT